jgi:hypothetical protein
MFFWTILSWVFVLILTAVNVVVFLKLKQASMQMLQMAFPGSKDMGEALARMQQMMVRMNRGPQAGGAPGGADQKLKAAMDLLRKVQKS